jgi:hypothetical protein
MSWVRVPSPALFCGRYRRPGRAIVVLGFCLTRSAGRRPISESGPQPLVELPPRPGTRPRQPHFFAPRLCHTCDQALATRPKTQRSRPPCRKTLTWPTNPTTLLPRPNAVSTRTHDICMQRDVRTAVAAAWDSSAWCPTPRVPPHPGIAAAGWPTWRHSRCGVRAHRHARAARWLVPAIFGGPRYARRAYFTANV